MTNHLYRPLFAGVCAFTTGILVEWAGHAPYWGAYATGSIVYWVVVRGQWADD